MERAEQRFWTLGVQYYVAARAATSLKLVRIYGNIYHHAIETLLKAGLSREHGPAELKDRKQFGHDLKKLWRAFTQQFHWADLDQFRRTIDELHEFEEIRYPPLQPARHSITMQVKAGTPAQPVEPVPGYKNKTYQVNTHSIDHLVLMIFATCRVIPERYFSTLATSAQACEFMTNDNPVGAILLEKNPTAAQLSPPLREWLKG
jgi:hypothetical protein